MQERRGEQRVDLLRAREQAHEHDDHRDDRAHQARAQLDEVREEGLLLGCRRSGVAHQILSKPGSAAAAAAPRARHRRARRPARWAAATAASAQFAGSASSLRRAGIEIALDVAHARFDSLRRRLHRRLEVGGRGLHFLLQLAQLVELHLAVDVGLDVVDVALQAAEQVAQRARGLRQPLGADDDQRHDGDDDDFGKADVEHAWDACAQRARRGRATSTIFVGVPLDLGVDGLAGDLRRRRRLGGRGGGVFRRLHAFLEALHGAAQVLPDVAQLLGAEDQDDDEKNDQPMPDAQATHGGPP